MSRSTAQERLRGYDEALRKSGLRDAPDLVVRAGHTIEHGFAATEQLLAMPAGARPDAILYASDTMALAGLRRLLDTGMRVPEDIAVAGYGDIPFAALSEPPLTTVRVHKEQIGTLAAQMLEQIIAEYGTPAGGHRSRGGARDPRLYRGPVASLAETMKSGASVRADPTIWRSWRSTTASGWAQPSRPAPVSHRAHHPAPSLWTTSGSVPVASSRPPRATRCPGWSADRRAAVPNRGNRRCTHR